MFRKLAPAMHKLLLWEGKKKKWGRGSESYLLVVLITKFDAGLQLYSRFDAVFSIAVSTHKEIKHFKGALRNMVRYIGKLCILRGTLVSKHLAPSEYWSMEKILEIKSKYCCFREHDKSMFLSKGLAIHCVGGLSAGLWPSKRFRR